MHFLHLTVIVFIFLGFNAELQMLCLFTKGPAHDLVQKKLKILASPKSFMSV